MVFIKNQSVFYNGKHTVIETVHDDGMLTISNPDWDYDLEGECVKAGIEYDVPYWITVNSKELTSSE